MGARIPASTRAIFFDVVGTLLVPEPNAFETYRAAALRHGLKVTVADVRQRFLTAYQIEETADRRAGWITSEEREVVRWRRIVGSTLTGVSDPESCFRELFEHFARPTSWRINPDAAPVIDTLRGRGFNLGIGSNYDSRLWPVLEGFPALASLRNRTVISSEVGYRKPAREFFYAVVRLAGCAAREVLFVGDDRANDYEGATAAGLRALLLGSAGTEGPADHEFSSLRALLD